MATLKGKQIVLGVCGGIAAYKAVELLRLLTKAGAEVSVVMTANACEFVTPLTFQTLSNNSVHTHMFDLYQEKEIGHISLADKADLCIVAPATANIIGKLSGGIADDLLSTTLMATKAPVVLAPSMNVNMYESAALQHNLQVLSQRGFHLIEPDVGALACGWDGKGKLPAPEHILAWIKRIATSADLAGERVLISAGPTREEIDPVRYISNYSSGKMGYAIARAAWERGAEVVLVSGPTALEAPIGVRRISVTSAREMHAAMMHELPEATVVIKSAAVADYRPCNAAGQKIKKNHVCMSIELEPNPDILAQIGAQKTCQIVVGFAAETHDLLRHAQEKLQRKNLDILVANDVTAPGAGFDVETNIVKFLHADGTVEDMPQQSKAEVAHALLDRISIRLARRTL
ncbi:MAG: bifunctional phosphopantothenoylcysteine decarboxylase/phosphopantothenate--cysteine ligase CoaBC [Desulfuromonadaceae bacterium]|nr:bifunctional phosphopantothenoylcysteine decarboxylase/phosphopantothenate--cysteine ligase CoaBC [Desulfuromonadaceae bacterium]